MTGRIHGVAGGGLTDATWAANAEVAKIGKAGEVKTAQMLNRFATHDSGVTVMHDLRIPIPGFTANVDHVVVSGEDIHIIDAKVWKPARYWTFAGKTRRGWQRFEPAEKKTMAMAVDALGRFLDGRGIRATIQVPTVVVWPSSTSRPLNVRWLRIPAARAMTGERFIRYADKRFAPSGAFGIGGGDGKPADPAVVAALAELLVAPRREQRSTGTGW